LNKSKCFRSISC